MPGNGVMWDASLRIHSKWLEPSRESQVDGLIEVKKF